MTPQNEFTRISDAWRKGLAHHYIVHAGLTPGAHAAAPAAGDPDHYFIFLNPERVPTLAWTRVTLFGKLAGHLVNPGGISKGGLVGLPASPSSVPTAPR